MATSAFVLITLVAGYYVINTIYNLFFHPLSHLPGPILCRLSNLTSFYCAFKGTRHTWLWQQFQIYGDKFRVAPNLVVFNNPEVYNQIFSYKTNRKLLNLAFTDHSIKAATPFINNLDGWSKNRDISHEANYLLFDILSDLCFGADFRTKERGENKYKKIPEAFDTLFCFNNLLRKHPLHDFILWLKPHGLYTVLEHFSPRSILNHYKFVEMMINERPTNREDMLHFLCNVRDPDAGERAFDQRSLSSEANLLIMAGSDTTAIAVSGIFFYITHHQRVYLKLVREIRESFDNLGSIIHGPQLIGCKYMRACIDETLRLAPGGLSELPREILKGGMELDGHFYPEGTIIGTPTWEMGRNEEHYGDATTFRPERWIISNDIDTWNPEEEVLRIKHGLHTFLKGPGDCVGQKLAIQILSLIFARTLWQFDVRVAPGTHVGEGRPELSWGRRDP
ncbi:cytochrome P450 [Corynespora cassiicola Philippines]|uniref:Cytochrome P450 n=1 Tax=Corynespora cassiicola Philippines TaxID=1448308 RepID=A0A2T2NH95_CORCC|nr:cytochrome P450 [Corynespora cassiicola Philippines]